jgi:hypothetical protein
MQPYAPPGAMAAPGGNPGFRGQTRNPVMVLILTYVTCGIYGLISLLSMLDELKQYTGKEEITPWHILIPYYNLYLILVKVPKWVGEAKQKAGARNGPANIILYFFISPFALAADLNEVWNPQGTVG